MAELIQETGGIAPGAIYAVDGDHASMVWSPNWRAEVPEHQRHTHLGVVGQATVAGWPAWPLALRRRLRQRLARWRWS